MSLLLIDDQGEVWDGMSRSLRRAFDSPFSGGEFSDYSVANLGFVAINRYGSSCQIRVRPSFVGEATLRSLQRWLTNTKSDRVVLTWLDTEWSSELYRGAEDAKKRLDQLVAHSRRPHVHAFLARQLGVSDLHPTSNLGTIMREWQTLSQPTGQRELMRLLEATLGNRYVIVKPNESGKLLFHEFGGGLYSDYETWRSCAIGAPIEEQPDRHFGRWVQTAYQESIDRNVPIIGNVDAIVRWPHAGRVRLRYKRIIVPMQSAGDGPTLLGGSLIDNAIDLRVGLG